MSATPAWEKFFDIQVGKRKSINVFYNPIKTKCTDLLYSADIILIFKHCTKSMAEQVTFQIYFEAFHTKS